MRHLLILFYFILFFNVKYIMQNFINFDKEEDTASLWSFVHDFNGIMSEIV